MYCVFYAFVQIILQCFSVNNFPVFLNLDFVVNWAKIPCMGIGMEFNSINKEKGRSEDKNPRKQDLINFLIHII